MFTNFAFLDFGAPELIIILAILLLLFGGRKLPELSRSLGESIKELKKGASTAGDIHKEIKGQFSDVKTSLTGSDEPKVPKV
jgi:sec-independent protein translocase protein TatA